ncbi:hypothetical protein PHLGIDRAFT_433761 [Phlebiopsis gigantea 11061_1 CR5-6]|uniref:C2H2-type domain-containing protein n=1 Tax=Phlebiopsis gigantea (strain 11061_1 CR5-6) TaxID=745531 RepID=A0A0C3PKV3_PHLG1|nr:hypothetical protein PHLGIDRAFT_433761 [Phlebiopsis gigantea 11061_1 CR5-6]
MKRSFDSSFVTESSSASISRTHSFHRRGVPLAAHPLHLPEEYNHLSYPQEQPLLTPTRYILADYTHDSDFQSNVWFQPAVTNSNQHWPRLSPPDGRPLTGLGITFEQPDGGGTIPYLLGSPPVLAPFSRLPGLQVQPRPLHPAVQQAPISEVAMKLPEEQVVQNQEAYSICPSADFAAAQSFVCRVPQDSSMLVDSQPNSPVGQRGTLDASMLSPDGPVIGLFPDINYRALEMQKLSPAVGINPEDITGEFPPPLTMPKIEDEEDAFMQIEPYPPTPTRMASPDIEADFPADAFSAIVSVLAESVKQENAPQILPVIAPIPRRAEYPPAILPIQPPSFASRTTIGLKASSSTYKPSIAPVTRSPLVCTQPRNLADGSPVPVQRPSPVLNAHEGVELMDLRTRADAFRRMNPGCELDKTFLQAFAGRLSERGELISEFRCYVKDCYQTNKRRDHILVHVGSHVEHRPFQCDECGMRFLRKNECKRHMSSHVGIKPYTCPICAPFQDKSFVRQDLLKRHIKVTHGAVPEQWPDRRKKPRLMAGAPTPELLQGDLIYMDD